MVTSSVTHLKPGDAAPLFALYDQDGKLFELEKCRKRTVIYFYPNDDSQTCTKEACNLRDNYKKLKKAGYEIIGISHADTVSKKRFTNKYDLPFRLLSDPGYKTAIKYGVYADKFFMGRVIKTIHRITFILDENAIIERIIHKVVSGQAAEQILQPQV